MKLQYFTDNTHSHSTYVFPENIQVLLQVKYTHLGIFLRQVIHKTEAFLRT